MVPAASVGSSRGMPLLSQGLVRGGRCGRLSGRLADPLAPPLPRPLRRPATAARGALSTTPAASLLVPHPADTVAWSPLAPSYRIAAAEAAWLSATLFEYQSLPTSFRRRLSAPPLKP